MGWSVSITVPDVDKCIICVAPHTSNWDFVVGKLAYASVGRDAGFLMKAQWFFWPLGCFFRAIGGIPVQRKNKTVSLTDVVVEKFRTSRRMQLAITPEGTRSRTSQWHTGFLHIAKRAGVPIQLGVLDYAAKRVMIDHTFEPTGDIEADLRRVKEFYKPYKGKYPEKFTTE
ncbi:1-acyl-sn-glycerol-3-phosphate acyltransferase [Muribaculum intestinale]|uniref:1-acyl-sn-glycerol-3-phosphate acyltransferase n=1 Tax=Muribaculum intestinale TaxID=1796646 RepID=UPI00260C507F|nr:1-acyl-sn-glycerol-3-phosphate acyltransferase [Muribaculum intestinale]